VRRLEKISVIVPVYNVEKYLDRCLQSIINQTYTNIEIILINDGSTDSSFKICQKFAMLDERVVLINKTNGGLSSARNAGLAVATGDYISFVDSDDYISPLFLEVLLSNLISEKADISECDVHFTSSTFSSPAELMVGTVNKESWLFDVIEKSKYAVWRRLYRKEVLENTNFKKGFIFEDVFFLSDIISAVNIIVKSNEKLYFYFDEDNSIIRSDFSKNKLDLISAYNYQYDKITSMNYNDKLLNLTRTVYESELLNKFWILSNHPIYDENSKIRLFIKKEITLLGTTGLLATLIIIFPVILTSSLIKLRMKFYRGTVF